MKTESTRGKKSHRGIGALALLTAAAALAGAAIVYLRRKGVTKEHVASLKRRSANSASILRGEAKAAYRDVWQAVAREVAASPQQPTRSMVVRTIRGVTSELKRHGSVTAQELKHLRQALEEDWRELASKRGKGARA